jgi:hypothetical protein
VTAPDGGRVRAFEPDDLPRVVALYARVGLGVETAAPPVLVAYLEEIFCRHPWPDEGLPSLVYEEVDGRITGCLGVMPRPMWLAGRPVRAVVTHNFIVDPGRRSTLAAIQLLQRYFAGAPELSLAESGPQSRAIWERLGGATSPLHSLRWTYPVRPGRYAAAFLKARGVPGPLALGLRALGPIVDAVADGVAGRRRGLEVNGEELDADTLLACLTEFPRDRALRPAYDGPALKWLLEVLGRKHHLGTLRKVLVRDHAHDIAGWYLYYLKPGGVSEVVQIGARPGTVGVVLDHLFADARGQGAVALSGQLDPPFIGALSDRYCFFRRESAGPTMLVHARHPDLLQAILRGDAFLTRLEGEWWIPFGKEAWRHESGRTNR